MRTLLSALLLLVGCDPSTTQWDAAQELAEKWCADDPAACVRGWCESPEACSAPVDHELFASCTVELAPVCWTLFRQEGS